MDPISTIVHHSLVKAGRQSPSRVPVLDLIGILTRSMSRELES